MTHVDILKIALVVALCSNAILLGFLLVMVSKEGSGGILSRDVSDDACCQKYVMMTSSQSSKRIRNDFIGQRSMPTNSERRERGRINFEHNENEEGSRNFKFLGPEGHLQTFPYQSEYIDRISTPVSETDGDDLAVDHTHSTPPLFISNSNSNRPLQNMDQFHSKLKAMQRNRLLAVRDFIAFHLSRDQYLFAPDHVINSVASSHHAIVNVNNELSKSYRNEKLPQYKHFMSHRTKRSLRSDVLPDSEPQINETTVNITHNATPQTTEEPWAKHSTTETRIKLEEIIKSTPTPTELPDKRQSIEPQTKIEETIKPTSMSNKIPWERHTTVHQTEKSRLEETPTSTFKPTKKPWVRRSTSRFGSRRGKNATATTSTKSRMNGSDDTVRPGRFNRNGAKGDKAFRRANKIAKRRQAKGKGFRNKKWRRVNSMKRVFARLGDEQVSKMSDVVTNVLLPSLVEFENLVGSHITGIRASIVSQELRIEKLEKAAMEAAHAQHTHDTLQHDAEDNLTDDGKEEIKDGVEETLMTAPNISIRVQVFGKKEEEGSGDGDDVNFQPVYEVTDSPDTTTTTTPTTTTTTPQPTTTTTTPSPTTATTTTTSTTTSTTTTTTTTPAPQKDANYEELYQFYSTLMQRVDDIHNYNMLSATELHRTQNMAIKMDDKVTEMERKMKNIRTRDARQLYRIRELEMEKGRMELSLKKAMKDVDKMVERFDDFRDNMEKFTNDVHKVNSQFNKYEQISDELRSADAYKAHDIADIRESVMNVENRVNGIYRVLDEGAISIRYEMDDMVKRVCSINKLIC